MKSPIILEGEPFDWEAGATAADKVMNGQVINWGAAMAADPGIMACPGCGVFLWREGVRVKCPDCGQEWNQREKEAKERCMS